MPYKNTIQASAVLATTGSKAGNFGSTVFVTANPYFVERLRAYYSIEDVRADDAIPTDSNAYRGLLSAFKQPNAAVPVFLGRRKVDNVTLTPNITKPLLTYTFNIKSYNETTGALVDDITAVYTDTGTDANTDIVSGLVASIGSPSEFTVSGVTSLLFTPAADHVVIITAVENLTMDVSSTESAAALLAAIQEEDNSSWYFLTCEDHSETFVLDMDAEIQATGSSDNPKQYRVSTKDANTIKPLQDPPIDLLGKLVANNNTRTAGEWHDKADEIFPEVAACVYNGQFFAGTTTWKFMNNESGVPAARDLITGKKLSKAKQGYIRDRNASWVGEERGVDFMHGGTTSSGEWIDVIRGADWIVDTIEVRLMNLLLNRGKLSFEDDDKILVSSTVDTVLKEAVDRNILLGYEPTTIPEDTTFEDQVERVLKDVKWTGYLAGAIHFIVVDGVLTYQGAALD